MTALGLYGEYARPWAGTYLDQGITYIKSILDTRYQPQACLWHRLNPLLPPPPLLAAQGSEYYGMIPTVSMNKLLVITLLIGLLSFGTQGFRVPRQAEGEEVAEAPAEGEVHHEEHAPAEEHHEAAAEEHHEAPAEEHHEAPAEEHHEAPAEEHHEEHPEAPEHHGPEAPEEAAGPLTKVTDAVRAAWATSVDTATGWIESVKGWNLEEKAKTLYDDTTNAVTTYSGILQDQMYHLFYTQ
ncbi:hypothetical protein JZ751_007432 [Albula glossodonta]|uniref:Apolipoprotein C-II n=1 Tax=Albula glossodonta TaxID=121402 RepID=A0A8T2N2A8_9TELE|nr:hypothetical protein JZ751_007432 [Albula glossodonta]